MATKPERLLNFIVVVPIVLIMYKVLKERKNLDKTEHNRTDSTYKIVSEISILKENIEKQRLVSREKESKLKEEIEREKDELTDKYIKKLDLGFIDENIEKSYDELLKEIEDKEKRINTSSIQMHLNYIIYVCCKTFGHMFPFKSPFHVITLYSKSHGIKSIFTVNLINGFCQ